MQILLKHATDNALVEKEWAGQDGKGLVIAAGSGTITPFSKAVTTAGTAVQITASSTPCHTVIISADFGNEDEVVIGNSAVVALRDSQHGIPLFGGNTPLVLAVSDLSLLWVDAVTSGDRVCGVYLS